MLDTDRLVCLEALLGEASVHRPCRGSIWVAAFRDETGHPIWRSTGLAERKAAQAIADEWEAAARRKRAVQPRKPTIRVRAGTGKHALGMLTQKEVATIMKISERAVRAIEKRAFEKLRRHPALRQFWLEWRGGGIEEASLRPECQLDWVEADALLALARTPFERHVVLKLLRIAGNGLPPARKPTVRPPTRM